MEYLFSEIKHTILLSSDKKIGSFTCPVRLEVSVFSDGSIYVAEIMETPRNKEILNSANKHNWVEFKECFKEAAEIIEQHNNMEEIKKVISKLKCNQVIIERAEENFNKTIYGLLQNK